MDIEAFVTWAMDGARTIEERFPVELLVERHLDAWHYRHKTGHRPASWETKRERKRQRDFNPAYQPYYTEVNLRRALQMVAEHTSWEAPASYDGRPVRNIELLRHLPHLDQVQINGDIADPSPLLALPRLRHLAYCNPGCEDLRFIDRLSTLRHLELALGCPWPDVGDLSLLDQLEHLSLSGNLLALPRGLVWPKVRTGAISCSPLAVRSLRDLPLYPACEFLTLAGIERLDGIEAFPLLRNLTLTAKVRDFSPLAALKNLTWFSHAGDLPLDVAPLARVPRLRFAAFSTHHTYGLDKAPPRNYSPLADSSSLRELVVTGCPPVEMEVAAINASLPPCDDLYLAETPHPLPPAARMVIVKQLPRRNGPHIAPGEPDLIDTGMREREGRWVGAYVERLITSQIGHADWGHAHGYGAGRSFSVTIESYEVIERLPEIVETMRLAISRLRHDYTGDFMIALRVPPPKPTPAQAELLQRFRDEQDRAESDRRIKETQDHLERLYLYELSKQEGRPIDPGEFTVPEQEPLPPAPWEYDDEDDENEEGHGNFALKEKIEPPPCDFWDDDHPLADNYRLGGALTLDTVYFYQHTRDIAIHLMARQPDIDLPDEEEK